MSQLEIDPQFASYVTGKPSLSYVQPTDAPLKKFIISGIERLLGRSKLEKVYWKLKDKPFDIKEFFGDAMALGQLDINHKGLNPDSLSIEGPLIFMANHPFGIVDGMVLCDIAAKARGNFRILIHSALCQDGDLAPYFLPVDFEETKHAMKTNIRTKQLALEAISDNIPLLIFPSGMVSTANKFGFGSVRDAPWTTFAAKLVKQSNATVVPLYFHGRNSRKFHIASHIGGPFRTGMLMHEALNKFGGSIDVAVGQPITPEQLQSYPQRQQLTDALYSKVQELREL
jgi:putative hemolysin